jgi:hypothetical protein
MPYAERTRKCHRCGKPFTARMKATGPVYGINCAIQNSIDAAIQMANKSGPYYDRWLETSGPQGRPRVPQEP